MYRIILNRKDVRQEDSMIQHVCDANGKFLDDQSNENVCLYETIIANLPKLVYTDEVENLLLGKSHLSTSAGIVSDINAGKYSKENPYKFIDVAVEAEYGSGGLQLLNELYNMGMEIDAKEILLNMLYNGLLDVVDYEEDPVFDFDTDGIIFTDDDGSEYVIVKKE